MRNAIVQTLVPSRKIFFIGFNKCATWALHRLMQQSGIASVHWEHEGEYLALEIAKRLGDVAALRAYLRRWTAYSDLTYYGEDRCLDANRWFRELVAACPRGFFVLNDRSEDEWIRSRLAHNKGTFLTRAMRCHGKNEAEVEDLWRRQFRQHREEVLEFFRDDPRFLHFRIDVDDIGMLVDFLGRVYSIDPRQWGVANATRKPGKGAEAADAAREP